MMNYLVTGCNSDIGLAITRILGTRGNRALLVSRSPAKVGSGDSATLSRLGDKDLTRELDLQSIAEEAKAFFDGPFTVVHSVGDFWNHAPLDQTLPEVANRLMSSHYLTLYHVIFSLIPVMRHFGGGQFIAFSCNSVRENYPEMAPFTSAKAAIETLIKCVSNEYSEENIQANALALPTIATEKVRQSKPQGDFENYITPEELASLIVDELSQSSRYINGNVIKVFRYSDSFYNQSYFERNPSGRR